MRPVGNAARYAGVPIVPVRVETALTRVVVDVLLKPEILDPQGQAILGALPALGISGVRSVRQGKHFEVELDGAADSEALDRVRRMAETLLANPIIEDFVVRVESAHAG
jgi:phosphoribosylformylglycinamidine synthase subunit PurS